MKNDLTVRNISQCAHIVQYLGTSGIDLNMWHHNKTYSKKNPFNFQV